MVTTFCFILDIFLPKLTLQKSSQTVVGSLKIDQFHPFSKFVRSKLITLRSRLLGMTY